MAIKSKGRTRGRRTVAAAPRRPLVVRKPPIWRRPWLWVALGLIAVGGIVFGVVSILHSHHVAGQKDRETLAMTKVFVQFRTALRPVDTQAVPPDALVIFPSVARDLPKIGKEIKGPAAVKRGKEIADAAKKASDALTAVRDRVTRIIPAEFPQDRTQVQDGLFLIARAVGLYQQVGGIVEASADLTPAQAQALMAQATDLTRQAGTLFDEGYRKLLRIGNRLGVSPKVPASVPVAPVPPSPSVTSSPSPTVAPSATGSATPAPSASPSG
jgi:hypothetical protein